MDATGCCREEESATPRKVSWAGRSRDGFGDGSTLKRRGSLREDEPIGASGSGTVLGKTRSLRQKWRGYGGREEPNYLTGRTHTIL